MQQGICLAICYNYSIQRNSMNIIDDELLLNSSNSYHYRYNFLISMNSRQIEGATRLFVKQSTMF